MEYNYRVLESCYASITKGASYFSRKQGKIHHLQRYQEGLCQMPHNF